MVSEMFSDLDLDEEIKLEIVSFLEWINSYTSNNTDSKHKEFKPRVALAHTIQFLSSSQNYPKRNLLLQSIQTYISDNIRLANNIDILALFGSKYGDEELAKLLNIVPLDKLVKFVSALLFIFIWVDDLKLNLDLETPLDINKVRDYYFRSSAILNKRLDREKCLGLIHEIHEVSAIERFAKWEEAFSLFKNIHDFAEPLDDLDNAVFSALTIASKLEGVKEKLEEEDCLVLSDMNPYSETPSITTVSDIADKILYEDSNGDYWNYITNVVHNADFSSQSENNWTVPVAFGINLSSPYSEQNGVKSEAKEKLSEYLQSIGLKVEIIDTWLELRRIDLDDQTPEYAIIRNIFQIMELERRKPGSVSLLNTKFGIVHFGAKPIELLLQMLEPLSEDEVVLPIISSYSDHNGIFQEGSESFWDLYRQFISLGIKVRIFFVETPNISQLFRYLKNLERVAVVNTESRIPVFPYAIITSHGLAEGLLLQQSERDYLDAQYSSMNAREALKANSVNSTEIIKYQQYIRNRLLDLFGGSQIVFNSCLTGDDTVDTNIAKVVSDVLSAQTIAPSISCVVLRYELKKVPGSIQLLPVYGRKRLSKDRWFKTWDPEIKAQPEVTRSYLNGLQVPINDLNRFNFNSRRFSTFIDSMRYPSASSRK